MAMLIEISTRNTTTASMALLVISLPHEGPMALSETWSVGDAWLSCASWSVTALISVVLPVMSPGAWTSMLVCTGGVVGQLGDLSLGEERVDLAQRPLRTSATDAVVGTCQTTPPLKSMLKLRPLTPRATMPITMIVPEMANQ